MPDEITVIPAGDHTDDGKFLKRDYSNPSGVVWDVPAGGGGGGGGGGTAISSTPAADPNGVLMATEDGEMCVSTYGGVQAQAYWDNSAQMVFPVVIQAGVNDQLQFSADGGTTHETFTIAPGSYADSAAVYAAVDAALGTSGERLDTKVTAADYPGSPGYLNFTAVQGGSVGNSYVVSPGATHDASVVLGSGNTSATLAGGIDQPPSLWISSAAGNNHWERIAGGQALEETINIAAAGLLPNLTFALAACSYSAGDSLVDYTDPHNPKLKYDGLYTLTLVTQSPPGTNVGGYFLANFITWDNGADHGTSQLNLMSPTVPAAPAGLNVFASLSYTSRGKAGNPFSFNCAQQGMTNSGVGGELAMIAVLTKIS